MINARTGLAAAALTVAAGAVIFLSTSSPQAGDTVQPGPASPVGLPAVVAQVPAAPVHPAALPPISAAPSPTAVPRVAPAARKPAGRVTPAPAPKATKAPQAAKAPAAAAPVQQQPQPADTEPNGTGGWQLPACYDVSCVAPKSAHTSVGTAGGSGLLGDTLETLTAPVLSLIGGL